MKWPQILTYRWWIWCLTSYNSEGDKILRFGPGARWRLKIYYHRYMRGPLHRPLCWIVGHHPYDDTSWAYHNVKCFRCDKILKRVWSAKEVERKVG